MATVHVVDDDESMRTALLRLLRASGLEAKAYASAGDFLLHRPANEPGCLLLDVLMPGPSGIDLQLSLKEQSLDLPVVFMTGHADIASCVNALKLGAVDYLEKPVDPDRLLEAVRRALQRDEAARAATAEREKLEAAFASLTPRERQVFAAVAAGKLNKQIAGELHVGERTIKAQRAALMSKLGTDSTAVLGRLAERLDALAKAGS
jgi:FixJ family two-component response regulator